MTPLALIPFLTFLGSQFSMLIARCASPVVFVFAFFPFFAVTRAFGTLASKHGKMPE
jgi:hypothetical protein